MCLVNGSDDSVSVSDESYFLEMLTTKWRASAKRMPHLFPPLVEPVSCWVMSDILLRVPFPAGCLESVVGGNVRYGVTSRTWPFRSAPHSLQQLTVNWHCTTQLHLTQTVPSGSSDKVCSPSFLARFDAELPWSHITWVTAVSGWMTTDPPYSAI